MAAALLASAPISARAQAEAPVPAQIPTPADRDCRCRSPDGKQKPLGTVQCVDITGHRYLVRCEMSTNTPYWRRLLDSEGCPAA